MAKKAKRKPPKAPLVPRRGPAVNLRPAGPHTDKRRPTRAQAKQTLAEQPLEDESSA